MAFNYQAWKKANAVIRRHMAAHDLIAALLTDFIWIEGNKIYDIVTQERAMTYDCFKQHLSQACKEGLLDRRAANVPGVPKTTFEYKRRSHV